MSRRRRGSENPGAGVQIICGKPGMSGRGARGLRQIVSRYLSRYAGEAECEQEFYAGKKSLRETVQVAALSRTPDGKRHPHQSRIPSRTLEAAKRKLLRADLRSCS